ncbi:MAG TPA: hypothetical protein PLH43_12100 [Acetivibrio sp.]|nr:hypothetical protein [Acetivibrio sp.]HQH43817.1 hypothetical protein [Syntrophorhabdaceae bacterium]
MKGLAMSSSTGRIPGKNGKKKCIFIFLFIFLFLIIKKIKINNFSLFSLIYFLKIILIFFWVSSVSDTRPEMNSHEKGGINYEYIKTI